MNLKIITPLEQFEIHPILKLGIGWLDFSITNSTLTLAFLLFVLITGSWLAIFQPKLIPARWQQVIESIYEFIHTLIKEQIGETGFVYFPLIFTIFTFVILSNLIGMIPYSFTLTSHIVISFFLSLTIFIGVTLLGFLTHRYHYFKIFLPSGASLMLAPLLLIIELISYFARVISLSVRLSANMMAGHTLLQILSTFAWKMLFAGGLLTGFGLAPLVLVFFLTGLELAIAILQAYVFTVLTCSYLNDALHMHH